MEKRDAIQVCDNSSRNVLFSVNLARQGSSLLVRHVEGLRAVTRTLKYLATFRQPNLRELGKTFILFASLSLTTVSASAADAIHAIRSVGRTELVFVREFIN